MTKTAWLTFAKKERITCTSDGIKDESGRVKWFDESGKAYELMFAKITKTYAFVRVPSMDR